MRAVDDLVGGAAQPFDPRSERGAWLHVDSGTTADPDAIRRPGQDDFGLTDQPTALLTARTHRLGALASVFRWCHTGSTMKCARETCLRCKACIEGDLCKRQSACCYFCHRVLERCGPLEGPGSNLGKVQSQPTLAHLWPAQTSRCAIAGRPRTSARMFWCFLRAYAATLRAGGAMNSGPIGAGIVARRMRSISALAGASSDHPLTSSTGSNWPGRRAPQSAVVIPWSSIQRTARWMTRLP